MKVTKQEVKFEDDNSNIRITYVDKDDYKISKLKKVDFISFIRSLNSLTSDILLNHGKLTDSQIDEMVEEEMAVASASIDIDQALTDLKESRKVQEPIKFSGETVEIEVNGKVMKVPIELTKVDTYNSPPPKEMSDRRMFFEAGNFIDPNAMKATSRI